MRVATICSMAALVIAVLADPALAQRPDQPELKVGDQWRFAALTRELNVPESPQTTDSNPLALSFPLEVGKRWRYATDWVFKPKGSKGSSIVEGEPPGSITDR